jgi:hypothetical protein
VTGPGVTRPADRDGGPVYCGVPPGELDMSVSFKTYDWDALPESVREFLADVDGGAVIERGGT